MFRYSSIPKIRWTHGKQYVSNVKYPEIPLRDTDIYVITNKGDRFDTLANQFYGDPTLWWVISIANQSLPQNSMFIPSGTQVRIPVNYTEITNTFDFINEDNTLNPRR